MGTFKINGGKKLNGTITPQGAKNETLQILCAVLLTPEEVRITNIPDIVDVNKLIDLLGDFGRVREEKQSRRLYVQGGKCEFGFHALGRVQDQGRLRGSIMIVGPLLARFGKGIYSLNRW